MEDMMLLKPIGKIVNDDGQVYDVEARIDMSKSSGNEYVNMRVSRYSRKRKRGKNTWWIGWSVKNGTLLNSSEKFRLVEDLGQPFVDCLVERIPAIYRELGGEPDA